MGTAVRPRLAVHFSGCHVYAQVIDDVRGVTLASVNTTEKNFQKSGKVRANVDTAMRVGSEIASRAVAQKIEAVVFDRGGFQYHGKVSALAEAARVGGLNF